MNLFQLVIKQMRQRALGTWLTLLSVTLGVGLAITILILYREAGNLFGQTDYGYDVIIGKPGSGTQLVMNTVYHIDTSPGNLPYRVYEEMLDPRRVPRIAVPIVMGDSYQGRYPVVGTTTNLFGIDDETQKPLDAAHTLEYSKGQSCTIAQGRVFAPNRFEAVIGSDIAASGDLKIGSLFRTTEGEHSTGGVADVHPEQWTVVGILKQSFTAMDGSISIPIRSYYAVAEHARQMRADWANQFVVPPAAATQPSNKPAYELNADGTFKLLLPEDSWQVSAILAKARGEAQRLIDYNATDNLAVVNPTEVMKAAGSPLGPPDFGFDAIYGPVGSAKDLVMHSVNHLGKSPGWIPYSVYGDIVDANKALPADDAQKSLSNLASQAPTTSPDAAPAATGEGQPQPSMNFYDLAKITIPTVVGDTYKGRFRIVGTTTNLFGIDDVTGKPVDAEHRMGYRPDKYYEFAEGRCFAPMKFEAIIGSDVALKSDLKIGSVFQATHGETASLNPDIHPEKWVVVGVLKKTFTANDACVFIPIKTDYTIGDHDIGLKTQWALQHGGEPPPANTDPDEVHAYRMKKDGTFDLFVPKEVWEISALMIKARGDHTQLEYATNNRNEALAVNPAGVMRTFFDTFLRGPTLLLLIIAFLVSIVAAVGILVSIYNSVSARMREIAIMRALGATRVRILTLICTEAGLVGLFGGILGLIAGHLLGAVASVLFNKFIGEGINWVIIDVNEVYYLLAVVVIALLAGLVPALKAYTTPVATNLVVV